MQIHIYYNHNIDIYFLYMLMLIVLYDLFVSKHIQTNISCISNELNYHKNTI